MPESLSSRLFRWGFNQYPAYRRTGGRITYIASDWREVRVKLPLNLMTRNYVGTIYGGSMYAAVDPFFMIMLIKILGPAHVVWDKAASIRFIKPGRSTLYAHFWIEESEVQAIRVELETEPSIDRTYQVSLKDAQGVVHAEVEKVIYIRRQENG